MIEKRKIREWERAQRMIFVATASRATKKSKVAVTAKLRKAELPTSLRRTCNNNNFFVEDILPQRPKMLEWL